MWQAERARRLAIHGKRANGTILSVVNTGRVTGTVTEVQIQVRVNLEGGAPYESAMTMVLPPEELVERRQTTPQGQDLR